MHKTKLVITGAGGFLTARIAKHFSNKYEIYPLRQKDLDVTDKEATNKLIQQLSPQLVIHAAAITQTQTCEDKPDLAHRVNVVGAVNVAQAAKGVGAKLVFLSTEQVFNGNPEPGPYEEDTPAIPNTVYGQTKLEAERRLQAELEELYIIRLSWLFGLPERHMPLGNNLFWNVTKAALAGKSIKLAANEYRGITYVYDIVEQFERVFDLAYGTYHFGSDNELSTYTTGVYILQQLGLSDDRIKEVLLADYDKYQARPRDVRLNYNKLKEAGIPIVTSQASITRAIADFDFRL